MGVMCVGWLCVNEWLCINRCVNRWLCVLVGDYVLMGSYTRWLVYAMDGWSCKMDV